MDTSPDQFPDYAPIRDHAVIGNQCTTALVRIDGIIDWCCLPHLDSPSVFAAILDAKRGGHFLIRPTATVTRRGQRYRERTNVLVTALETDHSRIEIVDFLPVQGTLAGGGDARQRPIIHRQVRCTDGEAEIVSCWAPRPDYARGPTSIERVDHGWRATANGCSVWLAGPAQGNVRMLEPDGGPAVVHRKVLAAGDSADFATGYGTEADSDELEASDRWLNATVQAWRAWTARIDEGDGRGWAGPWEEQVIRSELFLKLMANPQLGALAAAPTTSLPETLGGVRNWDYRFAWIRDAAQIAQAFFAVGHPEHADAFVRWAEDVARRQEERLDPGLAVLYPLRSGTETRERTLDHLEGYMGSGPVRIGNAAADQLQLDVYGELLNMVFERARLSGRFDDDLAPLLRHVADAVCHIWRRPDFGIWEVKNGPRHHVYSKVMSWVALDRARWLVRQGLIEGDVRRWRRAMDEIRAEVLQYGYSDRAGAFLGCYGNPHLDAASLLIPVMEFLPPEDSRVRSTVQATLEQLTVNDLVYRYRAPDGLPGEEGCFALCTCWLSDALVLTGRVDDANRVFDSLVSQTNHVGLLAEQIDPYSGAFLGNFPQAYSHVGLINSALYLAWGEGRELPISPLLGARRHRSGQASDQAG